MLLAAAIGLAPSRQTTNERVPTVLALPCTDYARGLEAKRGNFGLHVQSKGSVFDGSWHLGEDVWLPAGTEVRAMADGVVRYSAFSPTWTDAKGFVHWNLGNVIVIEHAIDPPVPVVEGAKETVATICSVSMHLASDRRVQVGDAVKRGDVIGRIGKDKSEENGRYPAHLHFGVHRGPYLQIAPSLDRELRERARSKDGLVLGPVVLRGELDLAIDRTDVVITERASKKKAYLSLLAGSTAPKDPPPDVAEWCQGYGDEKTLDEWTKPSELCRARAK